jgi:hypothetical protein
MISILNFIFTILFYAMKWTKQDNTCICFKEFLNLKSFESNFQFSTVQKPFLFLFSFFFFILVRQYSFSYFFESSHTLSNIFFTGPVSSSAQLRIQPTNLIFFGHLLPPDASHRLQPPRPPCRLSLCRPPPVPWSRLVFSPSPL